MSKLAHSNDATMREIEMRAREERGEAPTYGELVIALRDTLRMLEAAHRQLGMYSADDPRLAKARAALARVSS